MNCLICGNEYKSNAGLGHHIKSSHKLTTQEYYDNYIHHKEKYCPICKKPNRFYNFIDGYSIGCCTKHTNLILYGVENVSKYEQIKNKIKQSKLEHFGDENFNNHSKAIQTINQKYGVNVNNISNVPEIKEKIYETNMNNLGVPMPFMSNKIQEKVGDTKELKYGERFYTNRNKFYTTMKKCNFISKYELALEDIFIKNNIAYIPQYKDKNKYPYFCDFYLTDLDIFIEINVYPAHGPHKYTGSKEDLELVNKWRDLANRGKTILIG